MGRLVLWLTSSMDGSGRFTGAPPLAAAFLDEQDLGGGPNGGWAERRAAVCGGGVAQQQQLLFPCWSAPAALQGSSMLGDCSPS